MMDPILRVECNEPGGLVVRRITLAPLTLGKLEEYWEKLSKFPTLFNNHITDFNDFVGAFLSMDSNGIRARGLIWEVDDVGLIFMTDIYPVFQASGHFTFWDRRFRGREKLIREMIKYAFKEFGFRRIVAEVPLYTQPTLKAVERVGFVKEGRYRKYVFYQGEWWDVNFYSILKEEVLEDGVPEA